MSTKSPETRIVMAKLVAQKWLQARSRNEYRLTIFAGHLPTSSLLGLLKSFRDKRIAIAGVQPIPDLGIQDKNDQVQIWSENNESLVTLNKWLEKRGYETSGVW
jgi:hypothetical protein